MIASGRHERRLRGVPGDQLEAEDVAIEGQRPLEVGDLEVDVADVGAGGDGVGRERWGRAGHGRVGGCPRLAATPGAVQKFRSTKSAVRGAQRWLGGTT